MKFYQIKQSASFTLSWEKHFWSLILLQTGFHIKNSVPQRTSAPELWARVHINST